MDLGMKIKRGEGNLVMMGYFPIHPISIRCTIHVNHISQEHLINHHAELDMQKNCQLNSVANPVPSGAKLITGAISAQARSTRDENTGFSFVNCSIGGRGRTWLGRAWRPFSTVIFAYTFMSEIISPDGWNDWNDPSRDQTIFYGEYQCSGSGANTTSRVSYVHILNDSQAAPFLNISYIDGQQWLQPFTN
ncbi:hypothetical protein AMTR_s00116p00025230 [Amborella trichopoda]|uniref:pectinesterase n=1 Tax=Amborella trichopoda TaxID=13333 RepID=W1NNX8_AMBTC|nr:hypothetical protein AMTR_s00116p00025230 [Amborella trichopoda]